MALGLLFLRYVSSAFEAKRAEFLADDLADADEPEEYAAENVFWVPEPARWDILAAHAKSADIDVQVDNAMREIERSNEMLKDALPKVYGRAELSRDIVSGLIELFITRFMREFIVRSVPDIRVDRSHAISAILDETHGLYAMAKADTTTSVMSC